MITNIRKDYSDRFDELLFGKDIKKLNKITDSLYQQAIDKYKTSQYLDQISYIIKYYLSLKKVILSVLLYTQTKYLIDHNLKNIASYSIYYTLFHALNACVMLHPSTSLKDASELSHNKVIKLTYSLYIQTGVFDKKLATLFHKLKMVREAYSYKLPLGSTVLKNTPTSKNERLNLDELLDELEVYLPQIIQFCNVLTHIKYRAWKKQLSDADDLYVSYQPAVDEMFFESITHTCEGAEEIIFENEDYRTLGGMLANIKQPIPLTWIIIDKVFEELACSWPNDEDEKKDQRYNIQAVEDYLNTIL